jgi:hypothetical protein
MMEKCALFNRLEIPNGVDYSNKLRNYGKRSGIDIAWEVRSLSVLFQSKLSFLPWLFI